ncbi:MAG: tetratricopeptide repeat protein [Deltaproteobacteria bacterium]|nr:tetratricopeptide repeat protein [Deltaproteobacteria bacterium]
MVKKVTPLKWLVKTQSLEILGPYSQEAIEKLILEKQLKSVDCLSLPGSEWVPLGKCKEFQLALKESLPHAVEDRTRVVFAHPQPAPQTHQEKPQNVHRWQTPALVLSSFLIVLFVSYLFLFHKNRNDRSVNDLEKNQKLYQKALLLEDIQEWDKASVVYEELKSSKFQLSKIQMHVGRLEFLKGAYSRSQNTLKSLLAEGVNDKTILRDIHLYLGLNEMMFEAYVEALSHFQRAIQLDSKFLPALFNTGVCYYLMSDLAQAKLYFETYFLNSKDFEPHLYLGHVYRNNREFDKAKASYERALTLNPRWLDSYYFQAELLTYVFRNTTDALAVLEKILHFDPMYESFFRKNPAYYYEKKLLSWSELARIVYNSSDKIDSIQKQIRISYFDTLMGKKPNDNLFALATRGLSSLSVSLLGYLKYFMQDFLKAETYLKHSLELDPKTFLSLLYQGRIALQKRQYMEAQQFFQKILDQDEAYVEALWSLGEVYSLMNDLDTATYYWKRALEFDPAYIPAKKSILSLKPA